MNPEEARLFQDFFERLLEADNGDQEALLEEAESKIPGLRRALEEVLAKVRASDGADDFFPERTPSQPYLPYELLSPTPLGVGGMGEVYRVHHRDGQFKDRALAMKVLHSSGRKFRQRFELEKDFLVGLKHPNIARLLDHGVSSGGSPFFIMEFIEGEPIDAYCQNKSVREKVRVVLELCDAVSACHAHRVLHRDIKPSNILVREDGTPVLLDFGIAKSVDDETLTGTAARVMSGGYGSPEQILGLSSSTRSDVHGLGCLLFKLLNGGLPYPVDSFNDWSEAIKGQEPAGLTSGLENNPPLQKQLAGELDWIVSKAIRKEPERRYGTVEALASDLDAYLSGKAVSAAPESKLYLLRKDIARHKGAVVSTLVVLTTLLFAAGYSLLERNKAREAQAVAEEAEGTVREVLETYEDVFVGAAQSGVANLPPNEFLHVGAQLARRTAKKSKYPGAVMLALGTIERHAGKFDMAEEYLLEAMELLEGENRLEAKIELGGTYLRAGNYALAKATLRSAVQECKENRSLCASARNELGYTEYLDGAPKEAEETFRLGIADAEAAGNKLELAELQTNLSQVLSDTGEGQEAITLAQAALEVRSRILGPEHLFTAEAEHNLGTNLGREGQLKEASAFVRKAHTTRRGILGEQHPWTLESAKALMQVLRFSGELEASEVVAEEALKGFEVSYGLNHPATLGAAQNLGWVQFDRGRLSAAEASFQRVLDARRGTASPSSLGKTLLAVGGVLVEKGESREAEALLTEASDLLLSSLGDKSRHYWRARSWLGLAQFESSGRRDLACEGFSGLESVSGSDHYSVVSARKRLDVRKIACGQATQQMKEIIS